MFSLIRIEMDRIYAVVAWEEDCRDGVTNEEPQQVLWRCDLDDSVEDALTVGEYSSAVGWVCSDRINIDKTELLRGLGWGSERIDKAIDKLMQIHVPMIDDDEETDSFFLHKVQKKGSLT